jgi:hypothetical protein
MQITVPPTRSTNEIITATIWNTDIVGTFSQIQAFNFLQVGQSFSGDGSPLVTVANTTAETLLFSLPVTSTMFNDGSKIAVIFWGDWLHNNGTGDNITYQVRSGTTDTATEGTIIGSGKHGGLNQISATRGVIQGKFEVNYTANLNAVVFGEAMGFVLASAETRFISGTSGTDQPPWPVGSSDTRLKLTLTWSAASANNSYRLFGYRALWFPSPY